MVEIVRANDFDEVRALFREYHAIPGLSECVVGFEEEIASLPGRYTAILLGLVDGAAMGVAALRPFDGESAEMKRLYVRPRARGTGLGRRLAGALADEAARQGFKKLLLDTLPFMKEAQVLYRSLGYREIEKYYASAPAAALFFALDLGTRISTDERERIPPASG
jgi:GNAT superfamily N-acetyltransferase